MRILIVDDDDLLQALLTQQLSAQNYVIDIAHDGQKGWEYVSIYEYDLLILDVVLPQLDGLALCHKIRQAGHTLPILMLTSQDTSTAKIRGLDAGADDYVVKPFDQAELIARVRALLRRGHMNPLPILTWGDLWLNSSTHEVSYAGKGLDLTAKEHALLEMLLREHQHVFSKEEILDNLWSAEEFPVEATVRSHIRRLRHKLTSAGAPADLIATSHGRGYYLKPFPTLEAKPALPAPERRSAATIPSDLQQAQYTDRLAQLWQTYRCRCLEQMQTLQTACDQLEIGELSAAMQAEVYRIAHTLVGTLGCLGFQAGMHLAQILEQAFHPDISLDRCQTDALRSHIADLQQWIETNASPTIGHSGLATDTASERSQTEIRVMLVDDDPILLQTLPQQLQGYGFQVATLDDPQQFWPVLQGIHPDVLILDVQMPQINGLKLCQMIRSAPNWQKLPVMFLSVFADTQTQHEAFAVGADDYLCKPITAKTLCDRIQQRLQRIQALSQ